MEFIAQLDSKDFMTNGAVRKREAIDQVVKRYRQQSYNVRHLKTNSSRIIGLLINDITNPFYRAVAQGIEAEATRNRYNLTLFNINEDPERELEYLEMLKHKVDGIILGPTGQNSDCILQLAESMPVVQIDRQMEHLNLAAVLVDNDAGAYRATRLLIEKGHQRIGLFRWQKSMTTMTQRCKAYERALADAGITFDVSLVKNIPDITVESATQIAQAVLQSSSPPSAIFALNNQIGLGVLNAAQQLKLRIPYDLALVIFDDLPFFRQTMPSIAAVSQPTQNIGQKAIHLLLRQMKQPINSTNEVVVLPTQLIIGESV
jgi:DNA-binding LacI/PurR family transcriptional regulator